MDGEIGRQGYHVPYIQVAWELGSKLNTYSTTTFNNTSYITKSCNAFKLSKDMHKLEINKYVDFNEIS